ncbi:uncharacterized protein MONBRDRAFT_5697 [Monosiga brevicollis MX1]|uniref:tRNA wybutosine-synthesizing protein 3 homolog n=1 Tax=Monosiga brevicollis TaxID=81824 RepID=A9US70_MONBE|nr:uncharacterized protein MONBRDRAFT_5697 [Monosiga brevicollis MX1]EDQ92050.1 predicted protein [Monosiga brevicollis MX1]|eukprot:XP_001743336.1 hypothetical protein [Monosiga brevicollis MX1]
MRGGEQVDREFDVSKARVLEQLQLCLDNSKKGALDAPIEALLNFINELDDYVTTSSCSGRIALFCEQQDARKRTGTWLLASHDVVTVEAAAAAYQDERIRDSQGPVMFKFEPFVLHVQCRTLERARDFLKTALDCGLRLWMASLCMCAPCISNSGLVLGKKFMVAVRTTLKLESPVAYDGQRLVDEAYIACLVQMANDMFAENLQRIARFETGVRAMVARQAEQATRALEREHARQARKHSQMAVAPAAKPTSTPAEAEEPILSLDF